MMVNQGRIGWRQPLPVLLASGCGYCCESLPGDLKKINDELLEALLRMDGSTRLKIFFFPTVCNWGANSNWIEEAALLCGMCIKMVAIPGAVTASITPSAPPPSFVGSPGPRKAGRGGDISAAARACGRAAAWPPHPPPPTQRNRIAELELRDSVLTG